MRNVSGAGIVPAFVKSASRFELHASNYTTRAAAHDMVRGIAHNSKQPSKDPFLRELWVMMFMQTYCQFGYASDCCHAVLGCSKAIARMSGLPHNTWLT